MIERLEVRRGRGSRVYKKSKLKPGELIGLTAPKGKEWGMPEQ